MTRNGSHVYSIKYDRIVRPHRGRIPESDPNATNIQSLRDLKKLTSPENQHSEK